MRDLPRRASNERAGKTLPWLGAISIAVFWLTIWALLAPHLPLWPLLAYGFGFGSVGAFGLLTATVAPSDRRYLLWLLPVAGGLLGLYLLGERGLGPAALVTACLLAGGSVVGAFVGSRIEHPGQLLFVVPVSSLADMLSVHHPKGVSAAVIADEATLSVVALPFAMLGTDAIEPLLGVGDVVFLALYVTVGRVHQLSRFRTLAALAAGLVATAVAVVATGMALPALPFLGACMLLGHPEARRPRAEDRGAGWAGVLVLTMATVWLLVVR